VDLLLPAKYPFLGEASEAIIQNSVDIADLFGGSLYEDARIRGLARVEEALLHSEVSYSPLVKDYDRLNDILSYPYARILVSVIDDRFLTKRYALAESVRLNHLLKDESPATILHIARSLGVNSTFEDNRLKMHFPDYLTFSTRIKSQDWKLVNAELFSGYVFLPQEKFGRLLQNALQDRIEGELPLPVPDDIKKAVSEDVKRINTSLSEIKNRFNPQMTGELEEGDLPPCMRTLLANVQNAVNLPHAGRFALVSFLHAIGMTTEGMMALFSRSPDFNESMTLYQVKHITGESTGGEGYTPPECGTMRTNGICYNPDSLCAREWMTHPLKYYRAKTRSGKEKKE
jgi:DNA primase large subunit